MLFQAAAGYQRYLYAIYSDKIIRVIFFSEEIRFLHYIQFSSAYEYNYFHIEKISICLCALKIFCTKFVQFFSVTNSVKIDTFLTRIDRHEFIYSL